MVEENGPKQTITITLTKKDESTNWGPGLPNTTVETYDLGQIQGKDKIILIEENGYTWTIHGTDIESVPDANLSLAITQNPQIFVSNGVDEFFGDTIAYKFTHASDYIIAVTDVEYTGQELNPKPAEPTEEKATQVSEDVVSDSSTENENADNSTVTTTDDKASQTSNTVGKTESIYMNPLFYVAIAVALLAIIFVAFTFIKKKKN